MSEGDYFSPFSGLLKAFLFQREWSSDDKWGLPKLTGDSLVILSGFQRENTTLGESKNRQNCSSLSTSILPCMGFLWDVYLIEIGRVTKTFIF